MRPTTTPVVCRALAAALLSSPALAALATRRRREPGLTHPVNP